MNKLFLLFCLTFCSFYTYSQVSLDDEKSEEDNVKVKIEVVEVEIELDSANRNIHPIPTLPRQVEVKEQSYSSKNVKIDLEELQPKVGAFKVKPQEADPLMANLVKLGFGNYVTPYLEAYLNSVKNEKYAYGVHYKHLSSKNGPVDKENSGNGLNQIDIYGRYFTENNKWNAELNYERLRYHFYGYPDSLENVNKEDIQQLFHIFNAKIGVKHHNTTSDFDYQSKLDFHAIKDAFSSKETTLHWGAKTRYKLDDLSKIGLDLNAFVSKRTDSLSMNRYYFHGQPAYIRKHEKYLIKAGANLVYDNDTIGKSGFHIYPVIHVDIRIEEPHSIHAYVGMDGQLERMSYLSMVQENPFLGQNTVVNNQNNVLRLYAGARATVKKYISLHGEFSLKSYKNFMHYMNDSLQSSKFVAVYDEGNTSIVHTELEAMYRKNETFGTGLKLDMNAYSASNYDKIYHRPNLKMHYLANYKYQNKVQINADIYYISGIFAYNFRERNSEKLKSIVDLNLKATYFFNQKLSVFVEANNLLSKSYQYYQYYPGKKLNFLIGAGYVF